MVLNILIINFMIAIVFLLSFFTCRHLQSGLKFVLGIFLALFSGVIAVPYTEWIFGFSDSLPSFFFEYPVFTIPIGFIHALGLLLCVLAFKDKQRNHSNN